MGVLSALVGAAGTAVFQRTFLIETKTDNGIPRPLLVFDVVHEEEPNYEAEVTEHPVESGPEVTDHIQLKNPTLRIKGTVSATPLDLSTSIGNLISGGFSLITDSQFRGNFLNSGLQVAAGAIGAKLLHGASLDASSLLQGSADVIARSILMSAYERRARFDVVTKRVRYSSMVIESMTFPRTAETGQQLIFELQLKQIRVVSALSVQVGNTADSVLNSATSLIGLGSQGLTPLGTDASAQVSATNASTGFNSTRSELRATA